MATLWFHKELNQQANNEQKYESRQHSFFLPSTGWFLYIEVNLRQHKKWDNLVSETLHSNYLPCHLHENHILQHETKCQSSNGLLNSNKVAVSPLTIHRFPSVAESYLEITYRNELKMSATKYSQDHYFSKFIETVQQEG